MKNFFTQLEDMMSQVINVIFKLEL